MDLFFDTLRGLLCIAAAALTGLLLAGMWPL